MGRIVEKWNQAETYLIGLLALTAVALSFYGVIMRYSLQTAPDWIEETVTYMIIWAVFLMASTLVAEKGHVSATLLVERFPLKARRILAVFNGILALGFCGIVSWYGVQLVLQTRLLNERSVTSLRFPLWVAYLSVAVGCSLVGIRYMIRIYRLLYRFQKFDIIESHEMSREEVHP